MCGLFGAYTRGDFSFQELRNVETLAVLSTLRGKHSSGLVTVHTKKNNKAAFKVRRGVMPMPELWEQAETKQILNIPKTYLISGHTRLATNGKVNERNAHPIQEGPLIACHNGMIKNMEPPKSEEETSSDSRVLIQTINKKGLTAALNDADGSYAIVYLDLELGTLNFIRNVERPLNFMWNTAKTTLYWASESHFLHFLRDREGRGSFQEPKAFEPLHLHTFKLGNMKGDKVKLNITPKVWTSNWPEYGVPDTSGTGIFKKAHEVIDTALKPTHLLLPAPSKKRELKPPVYCIRCSKAEEYCVCTAPRWSSTSVPEVPKKLEQQVEKAVATAARLFPLRDPRLYRGWLRQVKPATEWLDGLSAGCAACKNIMWPESRVHWISPKQVVCDKCERDPIVHEYIRANEGRMFPGALVTGGTISDTKH